MYCCDCRRVSPSGSVYCAHCPGPRSFNSLRCGGGHRCDVGTQTCPICGNGEFSDSVRGIPTGWIAKVITVAVLIGLWKLGLANISSVLGAGGTVTAYGFGLLTNSNASTLPFLLQTGLFYAVLGWMLGWFLQLMPGGGGAVGKFLRGIPLFAFRILLRLLPKIARLVFKGILRVSGLQTGKTVPAVAKAKAEKGEPFV